MGKTIDDYSDLVKEKHALNKTIAPVETDETDASRAYAVGEQLIFNGTLYDVIAPISQHDVITTTGSGANIAPAGSISSKIQTLTNNLSNEVETRAKLGAHNLTLPLNDITNSVFGLTITTDSNGVSTVSGTSTSSGGRLVHVSNAFTLKAGSYKLYSNRSNKNIYCAIAISNVSNSEVIANTDYDDVVEFTINADTNIIIGLSTKTGTVYSNGFNIKPMITLISDASNEYAPYTMTNRELTEVAGNIGIKTKLITILSTEASDSYNPITIADELVLTNSVEIVYVYVTSNGNVTNKNQYCPLGYTLYEIRHTADTVTINAIAYNPDLSHSIYTIGRSRNGAWGTWFKTTMTAVT